MNELTSILALTTAIVVLVGSVVTYMVKLRKSIQEIHIMVNSRMSEAIARIDQLLAALAEADVDIPAKPESHNGNF